MNETVERALFKRVTGFNTPAVAAASTSPCCGKRLEPKRDLMVCPCGRIVSGCDD